MKKFTKILEDKNNSLFYKVYSKIELIIEAENEGEAGYKSDSILASIENIYNYEIQLIEETEDRIVENIEMYPHKRPDDSNMDSDLTIEEQIEAMYINEFGDRNPTTTEKMEWYHQMRNMGYDGIIIFKALKSKF
jgi:hypothetical protein